MTSINKLTLAVGMIISLLSLSAYAQTTGPKLNHFASDGISFDYPDGYTVADESGQEAQRFVITRKDSSVQLTIVAMRAIVQQHEMPAAMDDFKEPIIKQAGLTLGGTTAPESTPIQIEFGSIQAEGIRLRSPGNQKRIADVLWLRWSLRLVGLTFIRSDVNENVESQLWETVRSSLKVDPPIIGTKQADDVASTGRVLKGGVLNGKALSLPKPGYPSAARKAHAAGVVVVQILIDEKGDVISAKAVSGDPLLYAASVAAAEKAKFTPTRLAGQPVKVFGVIQYNFVAQPGP
jgi:TonB family protein